MRKHERTVVFRWTLLGALFALVATVVYGTRLETEAPCHLPIEKGGTSAVTHFTSMQDVTLHSFFCDGLAGERERVDLPGVGDIKRAVQNGVAGAGVPTVSPRDIYMQRAAGRADDRRGVFDGVGVGDTAERSWGWLADEVSVGVSENKRTSLFMSPTESRTGADVPDRLGAGFGFGTGGDDAFLFQRRETGF